MATRTDGTLVSWGDNTYGQVTNTPTGTFSAVAAGGWHSVAIRTDGTLVSWGFNGFGGADGVVNNTPAGIFSAIAAGSAHSLAIRPNGTLVSWGSDQAGQVSATPAETFSAVAAGAYHSLAISTVPANQAPLATDDFYGMNQASSLSVPAPGVLVNDSDPDEDPLTVELVWGPANAASFQLNPDGSFSYTPPPYFYGEDTFTYRAYAGTTYSELASVHITVSQPDSQGFITGGGKFFQDGRKCTFGFVAKVQGNGVQGNLEFQDHHADLDMKSESVEWLYTPTRSTALLAARVE